jgi:hypothetical protein
MLTLEALFLADEHRVLGRLTVNGYHFYILGPIVPAGVYDVVPRIHPRRGIPTYAIADELVYPGVDVPTGWLLGLALGLSKQGFPVLRSRAAFRRFMGSMHGPATVEVRC